MGQLLSFPRHRARPAPAWAGSDVWPAPGWQDERVLVVDTRDLGTVVGWHRRQLLLVVRLDRREADGSHAVRHTSSANLILLPDEVA